MDTIGKVPIDPNHLRPDARAQVDELVLSLSALSQRCRRQSLSLLVPMGEELSYRYQERLIAATLRALRLYRDRLLSE